MSSKNIHPTAIVDPNAKLGENVKIGAYSIIGPEVTIGNGTVVESHVVIEGETIIGENNYIFSFASIGKDPQDLKFAGEKTRVVLEIIIKFVNLLQFIGELLINMKQELEIIRL